VEEESSAGFGDLSCAFQRRQLPPSLPPAPAGLTPQQLKRRHIVAAIVHSENSYVATLQRLVNVCIQSSEVAYWFQLKILCLGDRRCPLQWKLTWWSAGLRHCLVGRWVTTLGEIQHRSWVKIGKL